MINDNRIQDKTISIINTDKTQDRIPKEYELFFNFSSVHSCKTSNKILDDNKKFYKKMIECLFKFTHLFDEKKSLQTLNRIGYADYKSLSGDIDGYKHKFMLSDQYGVLSQEEFSDSTLLIRLGKIDDHHKK